MKLYDLKIEHMDHPVGIGELHPRFSWKIRWDEKNVVQSSYRIIVRDAQDCVWDSGKVMSDASINIRYNGKTLKSRQVLKVVVEVTAYAAEKGETRSESVEGFFEMGLLEKTDWRCPWIEMEEAFTDNKSKPAPYIRKEVVVKQGLVKARAYQTAHGTYRFWINGKEGSIRRFAPGNTSYYHRLQYQVDDITELLDEGRNMWAVKVGDGWWRGAVGAFSERNNYGFKVQFLGQLELTYEDGSVEIISMDEDAVCATGGSLTVDPKFGTVYDANLEPDGWKMTGFDDSSWARVRLVADEHANYDALIAEQSPMCVEKEIFLPEVFEDKNGDTILDFGQNIAGYVRMTLRNPKRGQVVTLEHGEGLKDGVFSLDNVIQEGSQERDEMLQKVVYTAKGGSMEEFCPEFSIFGFRYVKLTGYEKKHIQSGDFTAIAVYSDLENTFEFECSNQLINKMVSNARWSQKGNYLDVPTDCPTRERAPWIGDASVYAATSAEFMNVYSFMEKWLKDVSAEQDKSGRIPSIAPSIGSHQKPDNEMGALLDGSAGWGDCITILPVAMYRAFGDKQIIVDQYNSAKRWVEYEIENAKVHNAYYKDEAFYQLNEDGSCDGEYIWDTKFHWGEWSEPDFIMDGIAGDFVGERVAKGNPVVATAYLRHSSKLLSDMARLLGKDEDAKYYMEYSEKVAEIYDKYLINEDGSIRFADEGRQAAYVRALRFDLVSEEKRDAVKKMLMSLIEKENYHLNTGFLSTNFLLNQLAEEGEADTAYKILEQEDGPSWLYPIINGATTTYESWDGTDKFFGSFNHYSLGAVCDFLFSYTCGIRIDESSPAYKHFFIQPVTGGTLAYASSVYESVYGTIKSQWEKDRKTNEITYLIEVPCNTTATIILPGENAYEVGSGVYSFTKRLPVKSVLTDSPSLIKWM